jgi:Rrf2 family protein
MVSPGILCSPCRLLVSIADRAELGQHLGQSREPGETSYMIALTTAIPAISIGVEAVSPRIDRGTRRHRALSAAGPDAVMHNRPMDISARTDYAIRALLMLAQEAHAAGAPISVDTLARRQTLPRKFLEAILADLRRVGIVTSQRGAGGGYRLSRPAAQISLGEIFRAVDGPLAEVRGLRPHETSYDGVAQHLPVVWVAVRASLRRVLDGTNLEQLLSGDLPSEVHHLAEDPDAWQNR